MALSEEFEGLDYDLANLLALGHYRTDCRWTGLSWGRLRSSSNGTGWPVSDAPAYRVIAKDPHPAESRENVTHPHVMDRSAVRRGWSTRHSPGPGSRPAAGLLHARSPASCGRTTRNARLWSWRCGTAASVRTAARWWTRTTAIRARSAARRSAANANRLCCGCDDSCCSELHWRRVRRATTTTAAAVSQPCDGCQRERLLRLPRRT